MPSRSQYASVVLSSPWKWVLLSVSAMVLLAGLSWQVASASYDTAHCHGPQQLLVQAGHAGGGDLRGNEKLTCVEYNSVCCRPAELPSVVLAYRNQQKEPVKQWSFLKIWLSHLIACTPPSDKLALMCCLRI